MMETTKATIEPVIKIMISSDPNVFPLAKNLKIFKNLLQTLLEFLRKMKTLLQRNVRPQLRLPLKWSLLNVKFLELMPVLGKHQRLKRLYK